MPDYPFLHIAEAIAAAETMDDIAQKETYTGRRLRSLAGEIERLTQLLERNNIDPTGEVDEDSDEDLMDELEDTDFDVDDEEVEMDEVGDEDD